MVDFNPELARDAFLRVAAPLLGRTPHRTPPTWSDAAGSSALIEDILSLQHLVKPVAKCFVVHPAVLSALRTDVEALAGFPPGWRWGVEIRANSYMPRNRVLVEKTDGSIEVLRL